MATNPRLATRRRTPKLSEINDGSRYYASYRDADGKCQRRRFTRDRKESEQEYHRWAIEHYDDAADMVIRDGSGFKGEPVQALPHIANAFIEHDEGRVDARFSEVAGPSVSFEAQLAFGRSIKDVVAGKGYRSTDKLVWYEASGVRSCVPERGSRRRRRWIDQPTECKHAAYANRWRFQGIWFVG